MILCTALLFSSYQVTGMTAIPASMTACNWRYPLLLLHLSANYTCAPTYAIDKLSV